MSRHHAIEQTIPMMLDGVLHQSQEVWRCVEKEAVSGWHFKCKRVAMRDAADQHTKIMEDGWLHPGLLDTLAALDVPVFRLFTLCALRQRHGQEPQP